MSKGSRNRSVGKAFTGSLYIRKLEARKKLEKLRVRLLELSKLHAKAVHDASTADEDRLWADLVNVESEIAEQKDILNNE